MNPQTLLSPIVAVEIPCDRHSAALNEYFGDFGEDVHAAANTLLQIISPLARRSPWKMYELSNASLYLAPQMERLEIRIPRTKFSGVLSGDALGVVLSLLALRGSYLLHGQEKLFTGFVRLRDFASQHPEAMAILHASD